MGVTATVNETEYELRVQPAAARDSGESLAIFRNPTERRSRAERWEKADVPWLSTVMLPWGLEVRLLNISSTGLLIESGSKLAPGNVTELKLCGADTELVIPVSFVRSEVGTVDHLGVRYRTAATFEKAFPLLDPTPASIRAPFEASSPATALSRLMMMVSAELDRSSQASVRTAVERAVRQAVAARNIQIRDVPIVPNDGSESIHFTVPTGTASPTILQAMFAPGYEPTELELKLLKAAAGLAAVVLQFEEHR